MKNKSLDGIVRRRNTRGVRTVTVAVSLPKELNQTINGIVVKDKKSRSLVISELLVKGLKVSGITIKKDDADGK